MKSKRKRVSSHDDTVLTVVFSKLEMIAVHSSVQILNQRDKIKVEKGEQEC